MVIIIGILLCLVPGIAVIYPLWRKFSSMSPPPEDESSLEADLDRRWESAIDGLHSSELEYSVGNLSLEDYKELREVHMLEAAVVLKMFDLSGEDEKLLFDQISEELTKSSLLSQGDVNRESDCSQENKA
ncbi:MAG: hypothetical protein ACJ0BL_00860 [Dehalococcoidia bacterium]